MLSLVIPEASGDEVKDLLLLVQICMNHYYYYYYY